MNILNRRAPAQFSYFEPSASLKGLVAFHYRIEVGDAPLDVGICSLLGQLQITLRGTNAYDFGSEPEIGPAAAISGPTTRAARLISPAGSVAIGCGLTPAGWSVFVNASASSLAHRVVRLSEVMGADVDRLPSACLAAGFDEGPGLLDAFLRANLKGRIPDPRIAKIDAWVLRDGDQCADSLASTLGMSRRTNGRWRSSRLARRGRTGRLCRPIALHPPFQAACRHDPAGLQCRLGQFCALPDHGALATRQGFGDRPLGELVSFRQSTMGRYKKECLPVAWAFTRIPFPFPTLGKFGSSGT